MGYSSLQAAKSEFIQAAEYSGSEVLRVEEVPPHYEGGKRWGGIARVLCRNLVSDI